ncbi:hypothetical protein BN18_4066 [Klebsiella pneumoniae subsp. pneumoniae ST512-K30BO]|uniref:Uncharacterized protein n=1 Tax=Klebsiella pneumoniae subsp. pneumoniae (strain HS11286) TaxID=1125630 RepID=A0A0H3GWA8_KLEPH|nr:hypothetical protein [Klebsiella pneumoniae]YP_005228285.1 hypothetical protein KPHS_39840 [Klebsiella pneumoniae subsp. pneumoniae HS11286]AGT23102.1 hypothetical protein N559_1340 [Klebsiella pneumoniae JM45]AJB31179.1 hypothetical protein P244_1226 [Klebsiella pneumoniae HK787]EOY93542.1 hypothetical protein H235_0002 [Klebsiella pneumoniae UHKPC24]EOZ26745.1 hypothetical protein H246_4731 [Klebsiella pneumoniae VAKPC269]EOZ32248.1 hypothetical protein H248_4765 [Klebsiella pneumoniae V
MPECERLGIGKSKLEFIGKTIQTHNSSHKQVKFATGD